MYSIQYSFETQHAGDGNIVDWADASEDKAQFPALIKLL